MKWLYLTINFCTIILPLIFSFHPRIRFIRTWKAFFAGSLLTAVLFVAWDILFTSMGVWRFNPRYITGIFFFNLPVEELLFFICVPFSCVFTYFCLDKFYALGWQMRAENIFSLLFAGTLVIIAAGFKSRAYTFTTFISTAVLIILLKFALKIGWFGRAVTVYILLLAPFLLVNGILTGAGLYEPVVIYNNRENMGIRLLTIPVEDVLYGFELFLLNLFFFDSFRRKRLFRD